MSALLDANDGAEALVNADLDSLAPKMKARVEEALIEARHLQLGVVVYECHRSLELQEKYYARGRTVIPPYRRVTNAKSNLYSWHGYGLAVDVIHERKRWTMPEEWWMKVAVVFKEHGLDWGGDWESVDLPHFQFAGLRDTPSQKSRDAFARGGVEAVWKLVGAA